MLLNGKNFKTVDTNNMSKFEDFYLLEHYTELLNEVQIQFNRNKDIDYGNAVIMAGGAGSGKGFILNNLVGIQGKVFDVDALKTLAMKAPKINQRVKDEFGVDLSAMDLKNPDDVYTLHTIIGDELKLSKKQEQAFFASVLSGDANRKPNVIFDVTLKDMRKFDTIARSLERIGYDKKKIHIVWVVNDIEVAMKQNKTRDRQVPDHILINTHSGVNTTMQSIVKMGEDVRQYLDGDIFFAFGKANVDTEYVSGDAKKGSVFTAKNVDKDGKDKGYKAGYLKKATYIQIKKVGKAPLSIDDISKDILRKIDDYTPNNTSWSK